MYDGDSVRSLRRAVDHLGTVVGELVGLHHGHLGPVREIDVVLEQTDPKRVWDGGASMDHCFSIRGKIENINLIRY